MKKILLFCLACIMTVTVCFASSCKKNPSGNGGNDYGVDLSGVTYNDATGEMYVGTKEGKLAKMEFPKIRVPRLLDFDNNELIKTAQNMGISFGI